MKIVSIFKGLLPVVGLIAISGCTLDAAALTGVITSLQKAGISQSLATGTAAATTPATGTTGTTTTSVSGTTTAADGTSAVDPNAATADGQTIASDASTQNRGQAPAMGRGGRHGGEFDRRGGDASGQSNATLTAPNQSVATQNAATSNASTQDTANADPAAQDATPQGGRRSNR
jgi:hypothetical protein